MRSDAALLDAARVDPGAFRELYERYAARVQAFHRVRTRDEEAAYDLTAETFAQAWLGRERFRDEAGGSAAPWLFAIARHLLLASVRRGRLERRARERLGLLERRDGVDDPVAAPEETWVEGIDEAALAAAFEALPSGQREAIRLRVLDERDYADVADALDTTPQAARVRVHRGISALRAKLTNSMEAF
jgi:RNA polymerase sigma factor (sigma-70 family)